MGKLIDLTTRLKSVAADHSSLAPFKPAVETHEVLNYDEQKKRILFHERRQAKRTILTEFVSAMIVIPEKGLIKVGLYDISEEGISFDLDASLGQFKIDEELSIRVYLNHKTYFPMTIRVKHVTHEPIEGVVRHGTIFLRGHALETSSDAALQYFIRFIETAVAQLRKDDGDLMAPKTS
jgi:hypothetical protein